jgi:FkbM family methyltransferase
MLKMKWFVRSRWIGLKVFHFAVIMRNLGRYALRIPHEKDYSYVRNVALSTEAFLDIGANSGQSALSFALYNKKAKIFSFEPFPIQKTALNVVQLILGDRFRYYMIGVAEKDGVKKLYCPAMNKVVLTQECTAYKKLLTDDGDTQSRIKKVFGNKEAWTIEEQDVEMRSLDDFAIEESIGFVKIDVQGGELDVIKGMKRIIKQDKPVLMVENGLNLKEIAEYLKEFSYEIRVFNKSTSVLEKPGKTLNALNVFFLPNE